MRQSEDPADWHGAHIVNEQDLSFSSDRKAKKRTRRRQNAVFTVMALLVIAVTAGAVLIVTGNLKLGADATSAETAAPTPVKIENATCPDVNFTYQDPQSFKIRVLNTTNIAGLASDTGKSLEDRGFKISSLTSGWSSLAETTGAVIAGPDGYAQAFTVQRQVPGAVFIFDAEKWGTTVDLAVGEKFEGLQKERKLDTSAGKLVCAPAE
ncbi:LytR C-terminal domain-containing protein [Arthrobacter sp. NIO-1057]|uniref:LytR C-terminal domain-containing protein n=1 Tax=Arthrobacter sp. NIO-1057 TaxID=993071 RepID=UPI00071E4A36|nr:LytR C-terminal domain-containing protein [Arthrobacter sp. NIO-1057]KSU65614.1 hypothetical protein AS038_12080 [Arthrobacter sp. NIO-1057]SCC39441.1 LytR cell envelope-related transcriptional attenuator [Arthrobacter sp. NIO-1057]